MLLQHLRNFEWHNEPEGVFFIDTGMKVVPNSQTNFLQDVKKSINIDNGHFFYIEKETDFTLCLKWLVEASVLQTQCGLMIRLDDKNWAKIFASRLTSETSKISVCVTNLGNKDESFIEVPLSANQIFFKAELKENELHFSYSKDNHISHQIRSFSFLKPAKNFKVGAYICNEQNADFEAILNHLEVS